MTCRSVVYTAVSGDRDPVRDDILCFTNYDRFKDPRLNAKAPKVLSHLFVEAEYSIWLDANVWLKVEPSVLVDKLGGAEVGVFRHNDTDNIYHEARHVIERGQDSMETVFAQADRYKSAGWAKQDLGMCFLIVRKHTERVKRLNEQWWAEICRYSVRDQISFPVVFDGVVKYWEKASLKGNEYFTRTGHGVLA